MADRGLRDVQLGSRLGKAQMPGGGLKSPQPVQRRQPCCHLPPIRYMSLCHPKRYKVSFVEGPYNADIGSNRLDRGAKHVHFHPRIDDKSSWTGAFFASDRDPPCLAAALPGAPRTHAMDGERPARHQQVLERRRLRGRKAVLAGLIAANAGAAS